MIIQMKMIMKKLALVIALSAVGSTAAWATTHAEVGDAGQTLGTAQMLAGGTTAITGSLSSDADLFGFAWGGGAFYADTLGSAFDTQLFLFNSAGAGVWANDDGLSGLRSYISDAALAVGTYYLGISSFNNDPVSASGVMFTSYPYGPQYAPLYPGETLSSWTGGYSGGSYIINFRSASGEVVQTGDVPEPASLALIGLGLAGLAFSRKRKAA